MYEDGDRVVRFVVGVISEFWSQPLFRTRFKRVWKEEE